MPNYLLSASNDSVVLRNYEGMLVHYHPTGEPVVPPEPVETQGVSALLEGQSEVLLPEGNPRMLRRRSRIQANGNGKGNGKGIGRPHDGGRPNGNGHHHHDNPNGHGNGNGHHHGSGNGKGKRGIAP